jgi:hypothetical protein
MREHKFSGLLAALFLLVMQTGCAAIYHGSYSAEPIEATVVDTETGEPLEGVIVVAHWQLMHLTFGGRVPVGSFKVMEAVTDQSGVFRFPAWGPEVNATRGRLEEHSPQLVLFKQGYSYKDLANKLERDHSTKSSKRSSDWHGKTVKLKVIKGTTEQVTNYSRLNHVLDRIATSSGGECSWKNIPRTIAKLAQQDSQFKSKGIGGFSSLPQSLISNEEYFSKKGCGSVASFLMSKEK